MTMIGKEWCIGLCGEPPSLEEADQLGDGTPGIGVQWDLPRAVALADGGREIKPGPGSTQDPDVADVETGEFGDPKAGRCVTRV